MMYIYYPDRLEMLCSSFRSYLLRCYEICFRFLERVAFVELVGYLTWFSKMNRFHKSPLSVGKETINKASFSSADKHLRLPVNAAKYLVKH